MARGGSGSSQCNLSYLASLVLRKEARREEPGVGGLPAVNMGSERREGVIVRLFRKLFHIMRSLGDNSKQLRRTRELKLKKKRQQQ